VPDVPQTNRKRILDGGKLVPVVGVFLFLLPLTWPEADSAEPIRMSAAIGYIFICWCAIIVGAAAFSRIVRVVTQSNPSGEPR
jgi:hypothetical protein